MFKVLTGEKKRRVISPATITASIAAHLLLVGGLVYASSGEGGVIEVVTRVDSLPDYVEEPKEPTPPPPVEEQPTPPAPAADQPDEPQAPVEALEVPVITEVPKVITPEAPATQPIDLEKYQRDGRRGPVITPTPPAGDPAATGTGSTQPAGLVFNERDVEVLPVLERDGLSRTMERYYPSVLRDARISGRVLVEVIVDENGRPRPGSARVIESSHPAFEQATLRVIERFRFSPAKVMGTPVPVRVTIPIQWNTVG